MLALYPILREAGIDVAFTDMSNLCCELQKFLNVKAGGKPKNRFRPRMDADPVPRL